MAKQLVRAGIKVTLSNSRGPASLTGIVEQLGPKASAGTVREAAGEQQFWSRGDSFVRALVRLGPDASRDRR